MNLKEKLNPRNWSRGVLILAELMTGALVLSVAFFVITFRVFRSYTIEDRVESARGLNGLVINEIDPSRIDEYVEKGYEAEGYTETEKKLYHLRDAHPHVKYLYVFRTVDDGFQIVFDLPTEKEPAWGPGAVMKVNPIDKKKLEEFKAGEAVEPVMSKEENEYLLTVYTAIYNVRGKVVAYAAVDYSMNQLENYLWEITSRILVFFGAVMLLPVILIIIFAIRRIIRPLEQMEDAAYTDELTGMKNRAAYNECMKELDKEIRKGTADFSIVITDINQLRKMNEEHGHDMGDLYLQNCAEFVRDTFEHGEVFRLGGVELIVVLKNKEQDDMEEKITRMRHEMDHAVWDDDLEPWEKVSVSIGTAKFEAGRDRSFQAVEERADRNMMEEKKAMKAAGEAE